MCRDDLYLSETNLVCPGRSIVAHNWDMRQRRWHMVGVYIFEPGFLVLRLGDIESLHLDPGIGGAPAPVGGRVTICTWANVWRKWDS